jgi:FAD/FMN-containing dehydrogenase
VNLFPAFRRGRGLSAIAGPVLRPADPGYAAELAAFNTAFRLTPGLVVGATSEADVITAVGVAAADGLPVATKGTGHGVTADVAAPVLISTRRLDGVTIDPHAATARVGAGATWSQVVTAAAVHGLAPLCGSSTAIGVAGYTLGGGLGPLGRRHGFAADHVRRLRLVTADARAHEIDADRAPELFWALRGAGKLGFGVVTELELTLFPVTRLHGGGIFLPGEAATDVLHAWRQWAPTLPEEASTSVAVVRLPVDPALPPALRGATVTHLRYAHLGRPDEARALLAPMRAVAPVLVDGVDELPYHAIDAVHGDRTDPHPVHERGAALHTLPAAAVDALLAAGGPHVDLPLQMVELRWMGGALARPASVPNAVAGRDAACSLYVLGLLPDPPPGSAPTPDTEVAAAVGRVVDALAPWSMGGALPNFTGAEPPGALWSARDRAQLRILRRAVDPDGMFDGPPLP